MNLRLVPLVAVSLVLTQVATANCPLLATESAQPQFGSIEVFAYDQEGHLLKPDIQLFSEDGQRGLGYEFKDGLARDIPFGTYVMHFESGKLFYKPRQVELREPSLRLRIQLAKETVYVGCAPPARGGVVEHVPPGRSIWIKIVALFNSGGTNQPIDVELRADGRFDLPDLTSGQQILMVTDGTAILHSEVITMPLEAVMVIDLAKN